MYWDRNYLLSISPIDGRYGDLSKDLKKYFSEFALIKYRVFVEINYFTYLLPVTYRFISESSKKFLLNKASDFSIEDAIEVKKIESVINHDVKAVEYFIKDSIKSFNADDLVRNIELIHFALTSQDINSVSLALMLRDFTFSSFNDKLEELLLVLIDLIKNSNAVMLSFTHGQPASPTNMGKELSVFYRRLINQSIKLKEYKWSAKFGGAVGNLSAHYAAYPDIDWNFHMDCFLSTMGLIRNRPTTQIDHYDNIVELLQIYYRISSILIDLCQDIWLYISKGYFNQKVNAEEVGSSTMPHKVNPINFENAEGNLIISNGLIEIFNRKLPVSRLQRDLVDSSVTRNIGVSLSHIYIAITSIIKGLKKLSLNLDTINHDLDNNISVLSEGIQTILRSYGYSGAYEKLKDLVRGNKGFSKTDLHNFVLSLDVGDDIKQHLLSVDLRNY